MSSRYYEIFNFINEIIEQSSFEEKIAAGIVLTGGGAKPEGLVDLAEEVFHRQVRIGSPQYISGGADIVKNPEYAVGVGLLLYAKKQKKSNFEPLNDDFLYTAKKLFRNFFYN